jgi:stearoyl-CoA desaturase (delta-9 desaturase)
MNSLVIAAERAHEHIADIVPPEGSARIADKADNRVDLVACIPFVAIHALGLIGPFLFDFSWGLVALCLGSYYLRMFGVTAGYHRYFSHRSYKLNRFWQFCIAFLAQTTAQKGVLWWAAHHRHHHKHSDLEGDIHSPKLAGFWWSHVGWILSTKYHGTEEGLIKDFAKYPELRWLSKYHLVPAILYGAAIFLIWGWAGLFWGMFLSTVLLWHGTFTINSLSHVYGSRRYHTTDTSRNNFLLAIVTMGEGWHNNHHCYMTSANQGFFWWEVDASYYVLKMLSWVGVARDLRKAPIAALESKRIGNVSSESA